MNIDNPFDKALAAQGSIPEHFRAAAVETTDTLDLAWKAAQAVFRAQAKPEHAISLLPIFLARADAERQRQLDDALARTGGATTPTAPAPRKKKAV